MHLVLIETSGNQDYIFSTNKLRENVGASELTWRAGARWVLEAVKDAGGPPLWSCESQVRHRSLCDSAKNSPIEKDAVVVEVIAATSGKAMLLVKQWEVGKKIIRWVTTTGLKEAPGLDICGVISDAFDWGKDPLDNILDEVRQKIENQRALRPGPAMRFPRLPIVSDCASSGYPSAHFHSVDENDQQARSIASISKWEARNDYVRRMNTADMRERGLSFANNNIDDLEKHCEWIAVIHADVNGLGSIFLKFGEHAECPDNREYVKKLRRFSIALDVCAYKAFLTALDRMMERERDAWHRLPIIPILLGGDDLTIVCDGQAALQFTHDYLEAFEQETGSTHSI